MSEKKYLLIDSGNQKKLEKVGEYFIIRPSLAAIWKPVLKENWEKADAISDSCSNKIVNTSLNLTRIFH